MPKKKKLTKSEVSDFLREDRERIVAHLESFETMAKFAKLEGGSEERSFYVYHGSRSVKMLELLLKSNEAMMRFVEKDNPEEEVNVDAWKEIQDVEPASIDDSVFGDS